MARPLWFVQLLKKSFPSIKFLAKLTRLPLLGKIFDFLLFEGDDIFYLPQDKVIFINKTVHIHDEYVIPSQILEHFIKKAKHRWIMDFCICRSSMQCKDYPISYGCLFLGEATLEINPQLGRHVSEDEALNYLRKCREAGLVHMIGRNKLDKQWLGVEPGEKLMSICNCCPCCCLWRVSSVLNKKIGKKIKKLPGVNAEVKQNCIRCGTCIQGKCFVDAIKLNKESAFITDECRGCGRCISICPQGAIKLTLNDNDYIKKTIRTISKVLDVT